MKNKSRILIIAIFLLIGLAKGVEAQFPMPLPSFAYLDINNIKALIYSKSTQFFNGTNGVYEFPKGSGKNTMQYSSFWICGTDGLQQIRVAADLNSTINTDFWPGPISVSYTHLTLPTIYSV